MTKWLVWACLSTFALSWNTLFLPSRPWTAEFGAVAVSDSLKPPSAELTEFAVPLKTSFTDEPVGGTRAVQSTAAEMEAETPPVTAAAPVASVAPTPAPADTIKSLPAALKPTLAAPVREAAWVDSVFNSLSEDQKLGQFFMVATFSNKEEGYYQRVDYLVRDLHVGGLIFFQGDPHSQAELTNRYQALAKTPLMVSLDAENGLGMRLDYGMTFPLQMTLGAIQDDRLIYDMGREIARQCKRIGVTLNFAPVVDVNSNPRNPAIGMRSFGEQKENVAAKGIAYMKGMQQAGVLACAKHFPGHGDTESDSHHTLPVVAHSGERLQNLELFPFRKLIADSVGSIIVGHLNVPFYENRNIAATLSDKIVTGLLKNNLGFQGLVITDAMNMRGVTRSNNAADANLQALLAGNDILLYAENVAQSLQKIRDAIHRDSLITVEEVDARVRKILTAKYRLGLYERKPLPLKDLQKELQTPQALSLKQRLYEEAVTVVRNESNLLPFGEIDPDRFASIAIGEVGGNVFQQTLSKYAPFRHFTNDAKSDAQWFAEVLAELDSVKSRTIVVSLHEMSQRAYRGYGISEATKSFIRQLKSRGNQVVLAVFGNPYSLKFFPDLPALVCGYEDNPLTQAAVAQILFGALPAKGKLPVSVEGLSPAGFGLETGAIGRLSYGLPESVGVSSAKLAEVDKVVKAAIDARAFPGAQVLVARKGKVIYQKNFGKLTYGYAYEPVRDQTLYDLASVTKVAATLQVVMALTESGQLDLNRKASDYLPELKGTNKESIVIRDLLLHQAGLVAFLPFWERTRSKSGYGDNDGFDSTYYRRKDTLDYTLQVAPNLYTRAATKDSVWKWVIRSPLSSKRDKAGQYAYVYSDLGLIMLWHVVEAITKEPMGEFLANRFYNPLGMGRTGFNPLRRGVSPMDIAPTENDLVYRQAQLRGTVHDQNAAMQGGVSGHAGLFSDAAELAILMQMNLQRGTYGGRQYLQPGTVPQFAKPNSTRSHRGLGWDRRPDDGESVYVSALASERSFGHSGFTGTLVWADPDQDLVFIFLSNRVYPDAGNNLINSHRIRRQAMDAVYRAIEPEKVVATTRR
jgi:beta-glucosidase-like glycosyl hydrolase/CubicO group peptidase (beta-lactamase class C family)